MQVDPKRQKLLGLKCANGAANDDTLLQDLVLKPGTKIMMMGWVVYFAHMYVVSWCACVCVCASPLEYPLCTACSTPDAVIEATQKAADDAPEVQVCVCVCGGGSRIGT
jgi:hypothetical protein